MITMAARSSITASAVRNTRKPGGTREPSSASAPSENAMSVAVGTAQPRGASPPRIHASARKMPAGTTTPPAAANTGSEAARQVRSCPSTISRLISSPTSRKKIGISSSFTHSTSE